MFFGRKLCVASMHQKERVIAPIMERELGVSCITIPDLNTDSFGTFSGEIERMHSPLETAKQKCIYALEMTGLNLAISSEGSFGPHPAFGFIPSNEEILYFYDRTYELEIEAREISFKTNFSAGEFNVYQDLKEFAVASLFPSHALIIKDVNNTTVAKGINNWKDLEYLFSETLKKGKPVKVETDMRAHVNPTRMSVIEQCTHQLLAAIRSTCPSCKRPGFTVIESIPGLPCEQCHLPTKSALIHLKKCKGCSYILEVKNPHGRKFEEAGRCDFCNP